MRLGKHTGNSISGEEKVGRCVGAGWRAVGQASVDVEGG